MLSDLGRRLTNRVDARSGEMDALGCVQACQDCVPVSGVLMEVSMPSDETFQKCDQQSSFSGKQVARQCSQREINLLHKSQPL